MSASVRHGPMAHVVQDALRQRLRAVSVCARLALGAGRRPAAERASPSRPRASCPGFLGRCCRTCAAQRSPWWRQRADGYVVAGRLIAQRAQPRSSPGPEWAALPKKSPSPAVRGITPSCFPHRRRQPRKSEKQHPRRTCSTSPPMAVTRSTTRCSRASNSLTEPSSVTTSTSSRQCPTRSYSRLARSDARPCGGVRRRSA